jgi:V-type H+-transporting ATPase subunit H
MSSEAPSYLAAIQNNIRARPISWEGAVRAKTITDADLRKIKSIDKVRKEQRKQTIKGDVGSFTALLLGADGAPSVFEAAAKRVDIIQYMLVLLADMVEDIPALTAALVQHPAPYAPFLPLLKNNEDTVRLLAAAVLTGLLAHAVPQASKNTPQIDEALPQLFSYLAAIAKTSDASLQDIAVRFYSAVLRSSKARHVFWKQRQETLNPLLDILRAAGGAAKDTDSTLYGSNSVRSEGGLSGSVGLQLLYHVLLVLWQLSFEGELVGEGLQECVSPVLARIVLSDSV